MLLDLGVDSAAGSLTPFTLEASGVSCCTPCVATVRDVVSVVALLACVCRRRVCRRHRLCLGVVGGLRQMVGDRPSPVHFPVPKVFPILRNRRMSFKRERSRRISDIVGRCA